LQKISNIVITGASLLYITPWRIMCRSKTICETRVPLARTDNARPDNTASNSRSGLLKLHMQLRYRVSWYLRP